VQVYNINMPVDYLIKKANDYIRKNGKSIIVIPDLEISGYFKISNGILRSALLQHYTYDRVTIEKMNVQFFVQYFH